MTNANELLEVSMVILQNFGLVKGGKVGGGKLSISAEILASELDPVLQGSPHSDSLHWY